MGDARLLPSAGGSAQSQPRLALTFNTARSTTATPGSLSSALSCVAKLLAAPGRRQRQSTALLLLRCWDARCSLATMQAMKRRGLMKACACVLACRPAQEGSVCMLHIFRSSSRSGPSTLDTVVMNSSGQAP